MSEVIVGFGEIGRAVAAVLREPAGVVDPGQKMDNDLRNVDVMHVCFPYSEGFITYVKTYIKRFKPEHVIIWSTLPIGTTRRIPGAVHSPVEGVHPELALSIRSMVRWVGANDRSEGIFFAEYFLGLFMKPRVVNNSDFTEALKLLSTTEYGINIEFARYKKQVADDIGMNYEMTKEWNQDYNRLYHNLGMDWANKYVLDAPEGKKGGHCVTPNALLLYKQYPDELVKIVGEI